MSIRPAAATTLATAPLDLGRIADVAVQEEVLLPAPARGKRGENASSGLPRPVERGDARALACEHLGDLTADAATGTRHEGDPTR